MPARPESNTPPLQGESVGVFVATIVHVTTKARNDAGSGRSQMRPINIGMKTDKKRFSDLNGRGTKVARRPQHVAEQRRLVRWIVLHIELHNVCTFGNDDHSGLARQFQCPCLSKSYVRVDGFLNDDFFFRKKLLHTATRGSPSPMVIPVDTFVHDIAFTAIELTTCAWVSPYTQNHSSFLIAQCVPQLCRPLLAFCIDIPCIKAAVNYTPRQDR